MKKIGLVMLILSLIVMITACSAAAPAAPAAPAASEPTATEAPEAVATEASEPTATAAPEAAATEAPEAAATEAPEEESANQAEDVQVIDVEMNSTGYLPEEVTVKAGSHVRFNFTNTDDLEHDLFNRQIKMDTGELSSRDVLVYDWVAPETPGEYVAECTLHEGLQLVVVVE